MKKIIIYITIVFACLGLKAENTTAKKQLTTKQQVKILTDQFAKHDYRSKEYKQLIKNNFDLIWDNIHLFQNVFELSYYNLFMIELLKEKIKKDGEK